MKNFLLAVLFSLLSNSAFSQDPYIGEIRIFAGDYAPQGWALCNGQLLSISQNQTLFSIIGTTYGGNGTTNFALPDLRGRVPAHQGSGSGLTNRIIGEKFGSENVTLTVDQLPSHSHSVNAVSSEGNQSLPTGNLPANTKLLDKEYSDASSDVVMKSTMIGNTGSGQTVPVSQPTLTVNYIIALYGIYPSRN